MSDKSFDAFLKQGLQHSSEYIDDDDFTARVMASLPQHHRLNPWLERLIVALPVTLIALLVAVQLPWRDLVRPVYGWLLTFDTTSLMTLALGVALVVVAVPLVWVLRKSALI
jgi:hypothetical protein